MTLVLAQEFIKQPDFAALSPGQRQFALLPFMHSESAAIHQQAQTLFAQCTPHALDFENKHADLIHRFGRFPHRNTVLQHENTPEETAFLAEYGRGF